MINALAEQFSHLSFIGVLPLPLLRLVGSLLYLIPIYCLLTLYHHFLTLIIGRYVKTLNNNGSVKLISFPFKKFCWNNRFNSVSIVILMVAFLYLPFGKYLQGFHLNNSLLITVLVLFLTGSSISIDSSCIRDLKESHSIQKRILETVLILTVFLITLLLPLFYLKTSDLMAITEFQTTPDIKRFPQWLIFTHPVCLLNLVISILLMLQLIQLLFNEPQGLRGLNNTWLKALYIYLFTALITIIYLGGYHSPFNVITNSLFTIFWFHLKQFFLIWIIALIKFRLPDFSYRQRIILNFSVLIPVSLLVLAVTILINQGQ